MYFNHGDTALMQNDYGAHYYQHAKPVSPAPGGKDGVTATTRELLSKSGSAISLGPTTGRESKRLSVQPTRGHSRSFSRNEPPVNTQAQSQRNYRMFPVGDYLYSFEFPIDGSLPETIKTDLGLVKYDLEAIVERSGAFRPNLLGTMEIPVVRTPAEGSLEQVEPIAISRNWEDQLHYDIVISGKSFPLGSQIPIAFKLTPLAKVECHRIKVFVTENIQHWTADKSVHRLQPAKKVLLFEKRAETASTSAYPGSSMRVTAGGGVDWDHRAAAARGEEIVNRSQTNLLGNLSSDSGIGPTEMEFNVQLPSCHEMKGRDDGQRLHFDTTYENIQINHWIKVSSVLVLPSNMPFIGVLTLNLRLCFVSPRLTNETRINEGILKSPLTRPYIFCHAKLRRRISTCLPTRDRPPTQTHRLKSSSAVALEHLWHRGNIPPLSPAPIVRTPRSISAAGPSLEASQMDLVVSRPHHQHIWPTKRANEKSPARCISFGRHHMLLLPLRTSLRRLPLSHRPPSIPPLSATMTARRCLKITSPGYPSTKKMTIIGA